MKKVFFLFVFAFILSSCKFNDGENISKSGVKEMTTQIGIDLNGHTVEQNNIAERLKEDNMPGSIKHLYIFSIYSGDCLLYSTVKGKVTSSGKRLTPMLKKEYAGNGGVTLDNIQDDGTYGTSVEYIYWWDSKGIYHQQYITGGMMVHISNQPIVVKHVTINIESNENK